MTILDPFQGTQVHGIEVLKDQNWLKKSLVYRPLGQGMKLAPKIASKGSYMQKYSYSTENHRKMTILDPFQSPQVHGIEISKDQIWLKKSLVYRPLGQGMKLAQKITFKGSYTRKYATLAIFPYIPI